MSKSRVHLVLGWLLLMMTAGPLDAGEHDVELLRQLCDSYGTFQGLRLVGAVTTSEDRGEAETKRIRYTIGYRETINHLPPMSIEHIVANTGEPHLSIKELAHEWAAFDGEKTGSYQRRYVAASTPARRYSRLSISPGYGDVKFRMLTDCIFHVGPVGNFNHELLGMLPAVGRENAGTVEDGEAFQGFPTRRLTVVADNQGVDSGLTVSVAIGSNPFILSVREFHGRGQSGIPWLSKREVIKLEERSGYILPTHVKWSQSEPYPLSYELVVESVERINQDFHGLWHFDSPTGTRVTDQAAVEMTRIPFTEEEDEKIRHFLGFRIVSRSFPWPRVLMYGVNIILIVLFCFFAMRKKPQTDG